MEILDLSYNFEKIKQASLIITGLDPDDPVYIQHKQEIASNLKAIKSELEEAKLILANKKQQLEKAKILVEQISETEKYIEYVRNNLPKYDLVTDTSNSVIEESFLKINNTLPATTRIHDVSPCPSNWSTILSTPLTSSNSALTLNSKAKAYFSSAIPNSNNFTVQSNAKMSNEPLINIQYVTSEELNTVPNYMRGRITLTAVNACVDSFNTTLNKKYTIMSQKRKDMKHKDLEMYLAWKDQDDLKKDKWYCTPDDLINLSGFRMDKSAYNIITILRHLKRIQEAKIKGMKSRYIVHKFL